MAAVIGVLTLDLHFPGARSLKDKRQALRSLEARLRGQLNVAVAEIEHQDLWQRSRYAVVTINSDRAHLESSLEHAASQAEQIRGMAVIASEVEIL